MRDLVVLNDEVGEGHEVIIVRVFRIRGGFEILAHGKLVGSLYRFAICETKPGWLLACGVELEVLTEISY